MIKRCAWCKRIKLTMKNGKDRWVKYKTLNLSNSKISDGLCVSCFKIYFPEVYWECVRDKTLNKSWGL